MVLGALTVADDPPQIPTQLARAERESNQQKVRAFPKLRCALRTMAAAMGVLLELTGASEDLAAQTEYDGIDIEPVSLAGAGPGGLAAVLMPSSRFFVDSSALQA